MIWWHNSDKPVRKGDIVTIEQSFDDTIFLTAEQSKQFEVHFAPVYQRPGEGLLDALWRSYLEDGRV